MLKNCSPSHRTALKRQRGTTLIEVLVAILILSIGMLGIAGLQASTLKYSQGGWARAAVASNLSDIADRIRTNPSTTTTAYQFSTDYTTQRSAIDAKTVTTSVDCESESTSTGVTCTADQLAAYQLVRWRQALARDLPGGAGYISGTRDTGYVATVIWLDKTNFEDVAASTTLKTATACGGTDTGIAARTCCPSAASAPAGARCTNLLVTP